MAWTRTELEEAFERYQHQVAEAARSGDWNLFADLFIPDATYNEHAYGQMTGREEIRRWIIRTMTTFPGSAMVGFPPAWYIVDVEKGWVLCDVRNLMRDPGDGSLHEASNITILHYAGRRAVVARGGRLQPDELPGHGAGVVPGGRGARAARRRGEHAGSRASARASTDDRDVQEGS